jgi:hypothetical protein
MLTSRKVAKDAICRTPPKESSDVAISHRTAAGSREIDVMAHHDVSLRRRRRCRILGHMTGSYLRHGHIPLTCEVFQVLLHNLPCGPTRFRHGTEGKERRLTIRSTTPSCFFRYVSLSSSFFLVIGKEAEEWWEIVWEDVGCA